MSENSTAMLISILDHIGDTTAQIRNSTAPVEFEGEAAQIAFNATQVL